MNVSVRRVRMWIRALFGRAGPPDRRYSHCITPLITLCTARIGEEKEESDNGDVHELFDRHQVSLMEHRKAVKRQLDRVTHTRLSLHLRTAYNAVGSAAADEEEAGVVGGAVGGGGSEGGKATELTALLGRGRGSSYRS